MSSFFSIKGALPALKRKGAAVLFVLLCLLVPAGEGWAEYLQFGEELFVNLPASWQLQGIEENKFSAVNQAEEAYFLLKSHSGEEFQDIDKMHSTVAAELDAQVHAGSSYTHSGMDAHLSQVEFQQQDRRFQGYLLCIESHRVDVVVVGFALKGKLSAYQDTLFSAMDSLAIGDRGLVEPGPISQSVSPYPAQEVARYEIQFDGRDVPVALSSAALEATQEVIEREARVLSVYGGTEYAEAAWKRYYRIVYRDLFVRSRPLYSALQTYLSPRNNSPEEIAAVLLAWVQGFQYERFESLSDFLSPLRAAVESRGDCDSRGMLYTILLHHYKIDAILMVSSVYKHSMAAVEVDGQGARFPYNDTQYLVAETTDQVELGLIDQNMSNTNAWIGIDFINPRITH
ncbi:MAG: hypothetical protein R6V86_03205 [Spirochaetia bacterium]